MTIHQRDDDQTIADRIREIKPPGCTCYIEIEPNFTHTQHEVRLIPKYRCHVHYPATSAALKGSN